MTPNQWKTLQQFEAPKKEKRILLSGVDAFFISFFVTLYSIFLTVALLGD